MSKIKVGLVQMTCTADKAANLRKAMDKVREAAAGGAQIVCLQELFTSLYFCDVEDYNNFALAEAIPGPSTEALGQLAAELQVVIIASLFEKRAQGIYHNTRPSWMPMVLIWASIVKCISRMTPHFMKNFTLPRGTWVIRSLRPGSHR
jgi:hypothetical protein